MITYNANTGAGRDATITLTTEGGTGTAATQDLVITQLGAPHTLDPTPTFTPALTTAGNLSAAGGTVSAAIALGGGATGWEASETLDYVSLTPSSGDASTTVVVTYDPNPTFVVRDVVINFKTTGPTGVPITGNFPLTQEGAQGITVVTDPADVADLAAAGGTIDVDVSVLGSATGWDAALTTNPGTFLVLDGTSGAAGTDVLEITYTQNADAALREGVVTLTATGGTGTAESVALTITQLGTGPNVVVRAPVGEDFLSLPAAGGTITATVALTGGATDWTAVASTSNPADFLTVGVQDLTNGMHPIDYAENTGVERTGTVTFTTVGGTGSPTVRTIDFTQLGAAPHTLDPTPTFTPALTTAGNLSAAGGTVSVAIALGAGATGWEASETLDYVSLTPSSGDASTPVVVTYDPNGTFVVRDVVITLTTTGPTGVPITGDVSLPQEGSQGITVVTDPADVADLAAAGGTIDVDVTLPGSATGWDAALTTNPGTFLVLNGTSGAAGTGCVEDNLYAKCGCGFT